jgi:ABC-2 type transport system permease protein
VTLAGVLNVVSVECSKLAAQIKTRVLLLACFAGPFVFAATVRLQSSLPTDTLFGRAVKESGFAVALVVLGFAALWALPVIASVVGGDIFSAEDRYGTWKTLLTRSRTRIEIFSGKVLAALAFTVLAVIVLAVSSVAAGVLVVGAQPLIDLSGVLLPPSQALTRVTLAWASVLLPTCSVTAIAVLLSVATRSSSAGVGLPVLVALGMQLYAFVDGPEAIRQLLVTSVFGAWHGLFTAPLFYAPLARGSIASALYLVVCLGFAYWLVQRRDIS